MPERLLEMSSAADELAPAQERLSVSIGRLAEVMAVSGA